MQYNYDYFISYAHEDNKTENGTPGFVDEFVRKLRDSVEHQRMFGEKMKVFFDKSEIHNMSDWDNCIRSNLASSRFLIVLLSPNYFKSEYCAKEFDWWMQHEMHRRMLVEGSAPMLIVDTSKMYNSEESNPEDVKARLELQARFPNWFSQIHDYQLNPQFDMHDLDRAKISDALDSLRKETKEKVQRQDNAENSPNNALYPRYNENFVGRRENLRSLRNSLSTKAAATYSALTGLGGFGKTELALTYGHAFAWDYQLGRVFVKCENETSLIKLLLSCGIAEMHGWELPQKNDEQQLAFLFNHLKAKRDEIVQRNVKEGNLNTLGAHILLILDNVNKLELIWQENLDILPDYFHVVITTRETPNEFPYIHSEPVDRLSEAESLELLDDLRPFSSDEAEIKAAQKIAKSLDGFTLVVELTGAYLARNPQITYQYMYEHMVVSHPEVFQLMADKTRRLARHSAETVATVLESTLSALSANARKALDFATAMVPDAVGFGWLPELVGLDEAEGNKILDELTDYSLLTPLENEPNIARIHRLVTDTVKREIPEETQKEITSKIRKKCNELLEKDKTFWCTAENSWNITPVSEFCLALAEQWTAETSEEEIDRNLTWMLCISGDMLRALGKVNEAKKVFQQYFEICEERVKTFPSNVDNQRELSVAYLKLGDLENSAGNAAATRARYEKALEIALRLAEQKPDDVGALRDLCVSYNRLGDLENAAGKTAAARTWYEKALEIRQRLAEKMPSDVSVLWSLSFSYERLGNLEKAAGNTDVARTWYEKALEIALQLAEKKPNDVGTQRDLCVSYHKLGDLEKADGNTVAARTWYEKVLEISQRLAKMMPNDVSTQQDLCISYERLGDLEKTVGNTTDARTWYEKALEIRQRLADMMPNDVVAQGGLCVPFYKLGQMEYAAKNFKAAKEWYEKVLKIIQKLADAMPENFMIQEELLCIYERLGTSEKVIGQTTKVQEYYDKALEIYKKWASKLLENAETQNDLSTLFYEIGDWEEISDNIEAAREWYGKTLEILQRLFDKVPNNVGILQKLSISYERLGDLEDDTGNTAAAREWYEKTLEILQPLADKLPENADIQQALAETQKKLAKLQE